MGEHKARRIAAMMVKASLITSSDVYVDTQFSRKFGVIAGTLVTAGSLMIAAYAATQKLNFISTVTVLVFGVIGVVVATYVLASRSH